MSGRVGSEEAIEASRLNVENLAEFTEYANERGIDTGLWTQSGLDFAGSETDSYGYHGLQTLRDFENEVNVGGITSLKTDVAWVGSGYSFGLNGVKTGYDIIAEAVAALRFDAFQHLRQRRIVEVEPYFLRIILRGGLCGKSCYCCN